MKLGILGAMESEVKLLLEQLTDTKIQETAGTRFYTGTLEGSDVVIAQCGIGKVCAAMCTQVMIDRYQVDAVINTGVAGGLDPALSIGDIVISTDAIQHDFDATAFGYAKGYMCSGGDTAQPTRYPADAGWRARFHAAAEAVLTTQHCMDGTIVSGDIFVSDSALKQELLTRFGAAAAEMEGAAVAQVACANHVPFVVVRAISDLAGQEASVSFDEFEKAAAATSAQIVCKLLQLL